MHIFFIFLLLFTFLGCEKKTLIKADKPESPKQALKEKPKNESVIQENSSEFKELLRQSKEAKLPASFGQKNTSVPEETSTKKDTPETTEEKEESDKNINTGNTLNGINERRPLVDYFKQHYSQKGDALSASLTMKAMATKASAHNKNNVSQPTRYQQGAFIYDIHARECPTEETTCTPAYQLSISSTKQGELSRMTLENTTDHRVHFSENNAWIIGSQQGDSPSSLIRIIAPSDKEIPDIIDVFSLGGKLLLSHQIGRKLYIAQHFSPEIDGLVFPVVTRDDQQSNINILNNIQDTDFLPWFRHTYGANSCINTGNRSALENSTITYLIAMDMVSKQLQSTCINEEIVDGFFDNDAFYFSSGKETNLNKRSAPTVNKIMLNTLQAYSALK